MDRLDTLAIIIAAVYRFYDLPWWSLTILSLAGLAAAGWIIYRRMTAPARRVIQIQERLAAQRGAAPSPRT